MQKTSAFCILKSGIAQTLDLFHHIPFNIAIEFRTIWKSTAMLNQLHTTNQLNQKLTFKHHLFFRFYDWVLVCAGQGIVDAGGRRLQLLLVKPLCLGDPLLV